MCPRRWRVRIIRLVGVADLNVGAGLSRDALAGFWAQRVPNKESDNNDDGQASDPPDDLPPELFALALLAFFSL